MDKLSILQLKSELRKRGASTSGQKIELFERLITAIEREGKDVNEEIGSIVADNVDTLLKETVVSYETIEKVGIDCLRKELETRNMSTEGDRMEIYSRYKTMIEAEGKTLEEEIELLRSKVGEELALGDSANTSKKSRSGSVISNVSGASNTSSVTERRVQAASKRASMLAKLRKQKEVEDLEREELLLKQKKERLHLETEIAQVTAEEQVYLDAERALGGDAVEFGKEIPVWSSSEKKFEFLGNRAAKHSFKFVDGEEYPSCRKQVDGGGMATFKLKSEDNPGNKNESNRINTEDYLKEWEKDTQKREQKSVIDFKIKSQPVENNVNNGNCENGILSALIASNVKNLLPTQQLDKFDGDSSTYFMFKTGFDNLICGRLTNDQEKLQYLYQHTLKRPNEIVRACMHLEPSEGYKRARLMLDRRYGDPEVIANKYVENVLAFRDIPEDDVEALDDFSVRLMSCRNAMSGTPEGIEELNNPKTIRTIVSKLSFRNQESWRDMVDRLKIDKGKKANFDDLVDFVERRARVLKHSSYGRHMFTKKDRSRNETSNTRSNVRCNLIQSSQTRRLQCWHCRGPHTFFNCEEFKTKTLEEKRNIIYNMGLCFKCLREGHYARFCRNSVACSECRGDHHSLLHPETPRAEGASRDEVNIRESTFNTSVREISIFSARHEAGSGMSVIPIKVKYGSKVFETHAFLDNGSSATFCSRNLFNKLTGNSRSSEVTRLGISTLHGERMVSCEMLGGLEIFDFEETNVLELPTVYAVDSIPVSHTDRISESDFLNWPHLEGIHIPALDAPVDILIGNNVPHALEPQEIIKAPNAFEPFAIRTRLGWLICGSRNTSSTVSVNTISVKHDLHLDEMLMRAYNRDFVDVGATKIEMSHEDKEWIKKIECDCKNIGNRYEVSLPLRTLTVALPYTKSLAASRLQGLKKKFLKDNIYAEQYVKFMNEMFQCGYAEYCLDSGPGLSWYIPHFGVTHPAKPGKVRVVFDCAAKVRGVALNDLLLQGPDLLSPLLKVLLRFREGIYAFSADIETMFYQIKVPERHRDMLRFLWWKENNLDSEPVECRMAVHLFGAVSSPSVANYVLRRIAQENSQSVSSSVFEIMNSCFYVDDCLYSEDSLEGLCESASQVISLCKKGGFNLTKFISPEKKFIEELPEEMWGKNVEKYLRDEGVFEKSLGVLWDIARDKLGVAIGEDLRVPSSKRQLLSMIASVYDPLGILGPVMVSGRLIMQELCRLGVGWDAELSVAFLDKICSWLDVLKKSMRIRIPRCIKPVSREDISSIQIHIFSDASTVAYGVVAYYRVEGKSGSISCSFIIGKARVAPLKAVSVPRLELSAATLSVKVRNLLFEYFKWEGVAVYFWTDSTVVLRYIENNKQRYQTFVANRVAIIRGSSERKQWRYVSSEQNPADDSSRGVQSQRFTRGPEFLLEPAECWPKEPVGLRSTVEGLEIKKEKLCLKVQVEENGMGKITSYYSGWFRMCKAVGYLILFKTFIVSKVRLEKSFQSSLDLSILSEAETSIIKYVQSVWYPEELAQLTGSKIVKKSSVLSKLNPILHGGLICVGGRISNAMIDERTKHPIILPYKDHVTNSIIRFYHEKVGHMGRMQVLSELRTKYWVIKGNAAVRRVLSSCIVCRRVRGKAMQQIMSELPAERVESGSPPFTRTGIDCFGPFLVKRGRAKIKRYGVLFTCLSVRAVHLEVAWDMSTDSFLNSLRRFLARRGQIKSILSDRGTNFVGCKNLLEQLGELDNTKIKDELLSRGIDWVFNPPGASNFGGSWERLIGVVRRLLDVMLNSQSVDDDHLSTLFCEIEAIINSRPLTVVTADHSDLKPITPNSLLNLNLSPSGLKVDMNDNNLVRRWKQVQYLAGQFWIRWRSEYLTSLQRREKWLSKERGVSQGDVVLLLNENMQRCHWPLGIVTKIIPSRDGNTRKVLVRINNKEIERPITKLVMILEGEDNIKKVA